jgi:O-antigen ligase
MFWKILLGLGILGLVVSICMIIIFAKMFYSSTANDTSEDLAFGGFLIGIILLVISFLVTAVSVIFVMRNSKKEWDAKNPK